MVAAAVALWAEPISGGEDYRTWWAQFLAEQLTPGGSPANDLAHYFQGSELMSFDYSAKVVAAIAGVHAWTYTNAPGAGAGGVRNEAVAYLRATIGAYALAAGQSWTRTAYGFLDGSSPDPNQIYSFVDGSDRPIVAGPYLALSGERSNSDTGPTTSAPTSSATPWATTAPRPGGRAPSSLRRPRSWKTPRRSCRLRLPTTSSGSPPPTSRRWAGSSPKARGSAPRPRRGMLSGVRTLTTLHFLAWPGVRATCLEADTNTNTVPVPTLGVVYTLGTLALPGATGKEAEFIYPFDSQRGRTDPGGGTCTVDLANHVLRGSLTFTSTDSKGKPITVTYQPVIQLPTGTPLYHYTLGPNGFNAAP